VLNHTLNILKRFDHQHRFDALRAEYAFFAFQKYDFNIENGNLILSFSFNLDNRYSFMPSMTIPSRSCLEWNSIPHEQIETLVFHIGMVELVSYWKIACPKRVIVEPFALNDAQKQWWKKLYYNGLGEFFYLNTISTSLEDFMQIESPSEKTFTKVDVPLAEKVIVPVGGGKDSVVTLELLRKEMEIIPLIVNPRGATLNTVAAAGFSEKDFMVVNRTLDATMLKLNNEGFLNGHTPFSALLAFISILMGFGSRSEFIALSNESSANEATVPGTNINHQYSKSVEFESDFRTYVAENINDKIEYFSFLRPLSEMQIAWFFSQYKTYYKVFRSCNAGSKTDSWCGKCPKCLFTWLILSPFISRKELADIFGKDLLSNPDLKPVFDELSGTSSVKPFECVGTVEEVRASVDFLSSANEVSDSDIVAHCPHAQSEVSDYLKRFNEDHFLPDVFVELLKSKLYV
jgi:hypothetical protein